MSTMIGVCQAILDEFPGVVTYLGGTNGLNITIDGEDEYTLEFDGFDVDDEDEDEVETPCFDGEHARPSQVKDHVQILDACVHALSRSEFAPYVTHLTTDGDGSDCEAIFRLHGAAVILKVRCRSSGEGMRGTASGATPS